MLVETILRLLKHPRFFLVIEKDKKDFKDLLTLNIPEQDLHLTDILFKEIGARGWVGASGHHPAAFRPRPKTTTGKHRHIIDLRPRPHEAKDHS
jgi:hypothetical protein